MEEYKTLTYTVDDQIGFITLNRPKVGNALDVDSSYKELEKVVKKAVADEETKVIVLRGNGSHFCAGGDIASFKNRIERGERLEENEVRDAAKMIQRLRACPKPVIGMIQGACVGAGLSLAMACDLRVMGEKSFMAMAFIRMALCGDTGGIYTLVQACGPAKALEYMMLGDTISAQEAYQFGLANKVVPEEKLEEETLKLAKRLVKGPSKAYAYQKSIVWNWFCRDYPLYMEYEAEGMSACSYTDDYVEAVESFLAKRPPEFKGR